MAFEQYLINGQIYRGLHRCEDGIWVIACSNNPSQPILAAQDELEPAEAPTPSQPKLLTPSQIRKQKERLRILQPLINSTEAIYDSTIRRALIRDISSQSGKSRRTIQRSYYAYLAGGPEALYPAPRPPRSNIPPSDAKNIRWAIRKYHYSSRKLSLAKTYEMMLIDKYLSPDGVLADNYPTFSRFKHYFYDHIKNDTMCLLARGKAHFTRRGLEFRSLNYRNNAFNTRCVTAGIKGKESVTVAYIPNNTNNIWLFENEEYYEFELTSASEAFTGLTFDEVQAYLRREIDARNDEKAALLQQSVANTSAMRDIVRTAASFKTEPTPASKLSYMLQAREREDNTDES